MSFTLHRSTTDPSLNFLWNVPHPPKQFHVLGKPKSLSLLQSLPQDGLAVVGTRTPLLQSLTFVSRSIEDLEGSGLIIVSGLARGIDTRAHEAALKSKLPTIAILGCGLNYQYPPENQELRQKIIDEGGLIITEFAKDSPPRGFYFLQRNRLIAAWTKATWVVEAGHRSGALNTARWAREFDRACFAVPAFPGNPHFAGNQTLLDRDHAHPLWGIHSLGSVWLSLATFAPKKRKQQSFPILENEIAAQVALATKTQGGISVQALLNWALSKDWQPEHFFKYLDLTLHQGLIYEQKGTLISY